MYMQTCTHTRQSLKHLDILTCSSLTTEPHGRCYCYHSHFIHESLQAPGTQGTCPVLPSQPMAESVFCSNTDSVMMVFTHNYSSSPTLQIPCIEDPHVRHSPRNVTHYNLIYTHILGSGYYYFQARKRKFGNIKEPTEAPRRGRLKGQDFIESKCAVKALPFGLLSELLRGERSRVLRTAEYQDRLGSQKRTWSDGFTQPSSLQRHKVQSMKTASSSKGR